MTDNAALREWITAEHDALLTRFEQSVGAHVPFEMWKDPAGRGGSSIAWLVFHSTWHADLAVHSVLCGEPTVLSRSRSVLGLGGVPVWVGLGETEHPALTAALHLEALGDYVDAVHAAIGRWIDTTPTDVLAARADGPGGLALAGVDESDVPWLYRMWTGQPASFFVEWEAIGHRLNHIGEMVSVRNRLGLSPF